MWRLAPFNVAPKPKLHLTDVGVGAIGEKGGEICGDGKEFQKYQQHQNIHLN
jgi:hypothetical protein